MAVPTVITDLSQVIASNVPAGSESVFPNLDDYIRALSAFIAQNYALKATIAAPSFTGTVTSASHVNVGGGLRVTGANQGTVGTTSGFFAGTSSGLPSYTLVNSAGGSNSKIWEQYADATVLNFRVVNDAYAANQNWMTVTRSGITVVTIGFPQGDVVFHPSSSPPALSVNGDMVINCTSNTNARISFRGSDGVTRVGNITLA